MSRLVGIGLIWFFLSVSINAPCQEKSLVNTSESPYAKLSGVNITDVKWTEGFWAERFKVCSETMTPRMWEIFKDAERSHSFRNFEIAAGLAQGEHEGPPFHDGDFYKWFEGLATVYGVTGDERLDRLMDEIISVIAKGQRSDGYIHTPVVIEQLRDPETIKEFRERLDFETYNMGHLMTAAGVHHRVTGKNSLLDVAKAAADFLYTFYKRAPEELAKNAICPSHYMGVTEMYRITREPRYLELAKGLIDIRSLVEDGTDHNQDRIPFRDQRKAIGHAVRANYLYAGAADVYLETGDKTLMTALDAIWNDMVERKLYVTGACGALYDGVSPDGTTYDQPSIQQVHQAYGRDFQLPSLTAHNESCANIGAILWNWRMLQATAKAQYADIMELTMYNSLLAGVSLDGRGYFYTNPLSVSEDITFELRWSKEREEYISYCNCCPPNTLRTLAEIHNYVYSVSDEGLWVNLYGGNNLSTKLQDGSRVALRQETDYPWDGRIKITLDEAPNSAFSLFLRIPGWSEGAEIAVNGKPSTVQAVSGSYAEIKRTWKKGDVVELTLPMEPALVEANPLVEETRNQVAVKRGPVVYCLEAHDIPKDRKIFDITIPADIDLKPQKETIGESVITSLTGQALIVQNQEWQGDLYRKISDRKAEEASIKLIPYYAWGNRGKADMTVWLPLSR